LYFLNLLWELTARLFLGLCVFSAIAVVGIIFVKTSDNPAINPPTCNYVNEAIVLLDGKRLNIPATKGTTIWYTPIFGEPDRIEYAKPILDKPWDEESVGFCSQTLDDRPTPQTVILEGKALEGIAQKLDLPSHATINQLGFGTSTAGGFLTFSHDPIRMQNPEHMVLRYPTDSSLQWQHTQSAGWIDDAYRISSHCSPIFDTTDKFCSVRIHLKKGKVSFEAWRLRLKAQPIENQPPPEEFIELARKLPEILNLFAIH
jgi:hypothetical protein